MSQQGVRAATAGGYRADSNVVHKQNGHRYKGGNVLFYKPFFIAGRCRSSRPLGLLSVVRETWSATVLIAQLAERVGCRFAQAREIAVQMQKQ